MCIRDSFSALLNERDFTAPAIASNLSERLVILREPEEDESLLLDENKKINGKEMIIIKEIVFNTKDP